jgi:hypothetical protein
MTNNADNDFDFEQFPLVKPDETNDTSEYPQPIKFRLGNVSYEIYTKILKSFVLFRILDHGIEFMTKVITAVPTAPQQGLAMYTQFHRTLDTKTRSIWDNVVADADNDPEVDNSPTIANFHARFREFIAAHATEEDRNALLLQMLKLHKPPNMDVMSFHARIMEFNTYAFWLPGDQPILTEDQVKQAFYNGMPQTWVTRFRNANLSPSAQFPVNSRRRTATAATTAMAATMGATATPTTVAAPSAALLSP